MTANAVPALARWLVAVVVAGLAVAVTVIAIVVLAGRQAPEALDYVPDDAVVVAELRLDLPGDQLQKVGNVLSHFPGFADQSTLGNKLDRAGDRLLELISNGTVDYMTDIKPWVSGPVYLALMNLETNPTAGTPRSELLVATTNGAAGCQELFAGRARAAERYRGLDIEVLSDGTGACVDDGRYVIAGDLASVKAGLDAHADGSGIDHDTRYRAARDALGGDRLATVYASGDVVARLEGATGGASSPGGFFAAAAIPAWSIFGVRAEDDAVVVDAVTAALPEPSAGPSLRSLAPVHPSELARHVPGGALAYAEVQGAGTGIVNAVTMIRAEPALADTIAELEAALAGFGGVDRLLGWVDDAGVVVLDDGADAVGSLAGGLLLLAPDEATAVARVESYRSLLALAALGGVVKLETTTVDGFEVTTVTLAEAAGIPAGTQLEASFAVSGRLVVVGTSKAVIHALLATDGDGSLAASDAFGRAMARGLADPRAMAYVSVGRAMTYGGTLLSSDQAAQYRTDLQPYLAPIEALQMTTTDGPDRPRVRIVMTVTQPQEP
jgi:Protein of unknown function (DUF3352)